MKTSHTELTTYLTCPRKHHHRYRDRRIPRTKSEALETGSRVDSALKGEVIQLPPLERALVDGHRARWKNDPLQLQAVKFEAPLTSDITIIGEVDAIDPDGNIVERKTTSEDISPGSFFWKRYLQLDPQVSTYLLAFPNAKHVTVDALKKSTLRGKKDETDQELYERALDGIANSLDAHYQRVQIVRHKSEHVAHVRDLIGVVRLIQVGDDGVKWGQMPPRNVKACLAHGSACEYLPICTGTTTIKDDLRYMTKERRS